MSLIINTGKCWFSYGSVQNGLKEGKWIYYSSKNKIHKIINYKKGYKKWITKRVL